MNVLRGCKFKYYYNILSQLLNKHRCVLFIIYYLSIIYYLFIYICLYIKSGPVKGEVAGTVALKPSQIHKVLFLS